MASSEGYLAIDLGATSGRAVVGHFDGERIALEEVHRFSNGPRETGDRLTWDIQQILSEVEAGIGAASNAGISSIGIDTWGVDFGLVDGEGEWVATPYCYRDPGVDGMMEAVFDRVPREEVYRRTGIQFIGFNSLYRLLSIARQNPEWVDQAETLLLMPDLLNFKLTGRRASEFTIATTTQFYNPALGDWDEDLLQALEIPTHILPEIVPPGTEIGLLQPDIAAAAGLKEVTVIAPACHDTGSAVAAVPFTPASDEFSTYISCGTWALVGCELDKPIVTPEALAHNFTNEGGVDGTWRFLKNVAGLWLLEESRREWGRSGKAPDYATLEAEARAADPFRSLIDPDHADFMQPGDMPARIRDFCSRTGQPLPETRGDTVRCILESLALKFRVVLQEVETITGKRSQVVHVVGGGCQNLLLCEWTAAATARTVVAGPAEATAIGNLLVQAMALGRLESLDDLRAVVRRSTDIRTIRPGPSGPWDEASHRFRKILGA